MGNIEKSLDRVLVDNDWHSNLITLLVVHSEQ